MDSPDFPTGRSPRRELQGPRPAPLKVRKDSHKIRKPPVAPPQNHHPSQQQQPRAPVIIYAVSPKVIHTDPSEFMTLVQRLTGSSSSSSYSPVGAFQDDGGAISPAARFASIEKTKSPEGKKLPQSGDVEMVEGVEINTGVEKNGFFPGILSPGPGSLPPIPPNYFSPLNDQNPLNIFHDFSPVLHSSRNYMMESSNFMPSPSNLLSSHIISPTQNLDLFNSLFDF